MDKVTLGGERLNTGSKNKVELRNYERSTHDLGYVFRTTMSAGTLVPCIKEIALPGDTFDIDLEMDIMTHPTIGPLLGSYKAEIDVFQAPMRLYQGKLHNNPVGLGLKMETVKLPIFQLYAPNTNGMTIEELGDYDNYQINPSSILAYLGIRGVGTNRTGNDDVYRDFHALYLLAYWDIYKNYYANKQEEDGWVIHTPVTEPMQNVSSIEVDDNNGTTASLPNGLPGAIVTLLPGYIIRLTNTGTYQDPNLVIISIITGGTPLQVTLANVATEINVAGTTQEYLYQGGLGYTYISYWTYQNNTETAEREINLVSFPLTNIDQMREYILVNATNPAPVNILSAGLEPYTLPFQKTVNGDFRSITQSQEGLGIKTYNSDLFNNWLRTEWIDGPDGISELTAIDTSSGSFTIDTLNLSKKVYMLLNRIAVSGGTYDDWVSAVYDHEGFKHAETPIYHGSLIKELVFQEVVSNSQSVENGIQPAQPLGTLAGKGRMGNKHKGGKVTIKVDVPSVVIGLVSITPRIDYSQGNDWDVHLKTMDDLHKPQLDEIGFQELITEQMAWWDTFYDDTALPLPKWTQRSAGKQPAWINYMTNVNRVRGNFAVQHNEMFMVLNRSYKPEVVGNNLRIKDLTSYVDPRTFNQIFADTALDSQNFWVQISVNMIVRRKISARVMPNL